MRQSALEDNIPAFVTVELNARIRRRPFDLLRSPTQTCPILERGNHEEIRITSCNANRPCSDNTCSCGRRGRYPQLPKFVSVNLPRSFGAAIPLRLYAR